MPSVTLASLQASFVIRELGRDGQGVRFHCPICNCGCEDKRITAWFRNPIDGKEPAVTVAGEILSTREGRTLEKLSLAGPINGNCLHTLTVMDGVVSWPD